MIRKFVESDVGKKLIGENVDFEEKMLAQIKLYKYECIDKDSSDYDIDQILGKQIITHLRDFFYKTKRTKTQKNRPKRYLRKTIRKY
jgi:hypothetical protein